MKILINKNWLVHGMAQKTVDAFIGSGLLLIAGMITTIIPGFNIYEVVAQTSTSGNMTGVMMGSTRFHLNTANELLAKGDTEGALDQIKLAELQLSLLDMNSEGANAMNQTSAMEFIIGGSLSSMKMAANCIIDNEARVRCMP